MKSDGGEHLRQKGQAMPNNFKMFFEVMILFGSKIPLGT